MQLQVRGRFQRAVEYQVSYTLSKARDDVSDVFDLAGAYVLPQNSQTFEGEYGLANFDVRHRFSYNFIYYLPRLTKGGRFTRLLLNGFEIAGTGQFQTGQPFTVNSTIDINQDSNLTDRLNTTNGLISTSNGRQPLVLTTTDTLSLLAPFGEDGAIVRNSFRAGNTLDLNVALMKKFEFSTSQSIALRIEVFNFLNRSNFAIPVRLLEAPGFGQATSTLTPARRVQLSVKYAF
jgi:hypothetical protein